MAGRRVSSAGFPLACHDKKVIKNASRFWFFWHAASSPMISRRELGLGSAALAVTLAAPARADAPLSPTQADRIRIFKKRRKLLLLRDGKVIKSYPVALGSHPIGPKLRQGDGRTPEGVYTIDWRKEDTPYHRALHISYPEPVDWARAAEARADPGGAIFIHGLPKPFAWMDPIRFVKDWTNGCVSVSNRAIDEIWDAVDDGTIVEIRA